MEFNEILKNELKYQKKSQKELAVYLHVQQYTIHDWISGRCEPSIYFIKKICEFLDVTSDYLLGINDY